MFACCFSMAVFNGAVKATRDNGVRARIYTTRVQLLRQRWNEAIAAGSSHARDGTGILIRLHHTGTTTFTTSLNSLKLCILPTQCIQMRHVILIFNSFGSWSFPVYVIKAYRELEVALHSFLILMLEVGGKFTFTVNWTGVCVCSRAGHGVWEEEALLLQKGSERFLGFPVLA